MAAAVQVHRMCDNMLIRELMAMRLDPDEFVVFGSAPLLIYGLRDRVSDLDVVARGEVLRWAQRHGTRGVGTYSGEPVWQFDHGRIQFSAGWIDGKWDVDALIERSKFVDDLNLRFASLRDVLRYKKELRRPKDLLDIHLIQRHLDGLDR